MKDILNMFGLANAPPPPEEPSNEDDSALFSDEKAPIDDSLLALPSKNAPIDDSLLAAPIKFTLPKEEQKKTQTEEQTKEPKLKTQREHKDGSNFTKDRPPGKTMMGNRSEVSTAAISEAVPTKDVPKEAIVEQNVILGGRRRYKIKRYSKSRRRYSKTKRRYNKTKRTHKTR